MRGSYSLAEHGTICRSRDFPDQPDTFFHLHLPDADFDSLRQFVIRQAHDAALTYGIRRGHEQIKAGNCVGFVETPERVRVEILPKISLAPNDAGPDLARATLVKMLRRLPDSPFRRLGEAGLRASVLPFWEVFLTAFLADAQTLIGQGLTSDFVVEDVERPFVRGKWRIADQLRQPVLHPHRLPLRLSHRQLDIAPNRLLKSTLTLVFQRTQIAANQQLARKLLTSLADVSLSENPGLDREKSRQMGRRYDCYGVVLDWADLLLSGQVPGVSAGERVGLSLLFPMARVFEAYVSAGCRQYGAGVSVQESSAHLVEAHTDGPRFGLRPDILIRQAGQIRVLDTKWKTVRGHDPAGNYGLEQADLYQLYAYGQKYEAADVYLVFPANETFREPLPVFQYDARVRLHVVPFDLTRPLGQAVETLLGSPLLTTLPPV